MQTATSPELPDFTGTWRANLEKSVFRGSTPQQILTRIEHRAARIDQEILVTHPGGDPERIVFVFETTGSEITNSVRGQAARTRAHWDCGELVIESWMETRDRQFHFKDHWSLSEDGQTLTMAHRDDDLAGQTVVNEKVPHVATGNHP